MKMAESPKLPLPIFHEGIKIIPVALTFIIPCSVFYESIE
jgi:hypothetical protein